LTELLSFSHTVGTPPFTQRRYRTYEMLFIFLSRKWITYKPNNPSTVLFKSTDAVMAPKFIVMFAK